MGVLSENAIIGASAAGGYDIDNSSRWEPSDSPSLLRTVTIGSQTDAQKATFSCWFKIDDGDDFQTDGTADVYRALVGWGHNTDSKFAIGLHDQSINGNKVCLAIKSRDSGGSLYFNCLSTRLIRDIGQWYHLLVVFDGTQGDNANRIRAWLNGEAVTWSTYTNSQTTFYISGNSNNRASVGVADGVGGVNAYWSGYIAETHWIDGQALAVGDFAETDAATNEWKAIEYTGTYGNNGFYMNFDNSSSMGADSSGNGNNYTVANLAATDQMLDTPTNNFPTFNSLTNYPNPQGAGTETLTEGNTRFKITTNAYGSKICNGVVNSGKWYMEILVNDLYLDNQFFAAIASFDNVDESQMFYHCTTGSGDGWGYHNTDPNARTWNMTTEAAVTTGLTAVAVGDIFAIALDLDSSPRSVKFYINNTLAATIADIDASGTMKNIIVGMGERGVDQDMIVNFGQDSSFAGLKTAQGNTDGNGYGDFYYAPPTGYMANCTKNLPDPSIALPGEYFNSILYTGDGGTDQAQTGVGFQPDFVWGKAFVDSKPPWMFDVIRGTGELIESSSSGPESTHADMLNSFDADGFTHGNQSSIGANGSNYIAWNWKGGGAGVENTDGNITSTVSANTTAGFSIVKYTGTGNTSSTVGHGLGEAPEYIIIKNYDETQAWKVGSTWMSTGDPWNDYELLELNTNAAMVNDNGVWRTAPTASVFHLWDGNSVNQSTKNMVAYCFHSVEGYLKVNRYTGNGNANGTFVETGFEPKFLMVKNVGATGGWAMLDRVRYPSNVVRNKLWANLNDGVVTPEDIVDFDSNGFKWRTTDSSYNDTNNTYLYLAFAESPFKYSRAV